MVKKINKILEDFISEECLTAKDAEINMDEFYRAFCQWHLKQFKDNHPPARSWFSAEITKKFSKFVSIKIKGIQLL